MHNIALRMEIKYSRKFVTIIQKREKINQEMNTFGFEWIEPYLCTSFHKRAMRKAYLLSGVARIIALQHSRKCKNAVFLWIPKNAGTSIYSVLVQYGCIKFKDIKSAKYAFPQKGFVTFGHMSYEQLVDKDIVSTYFNNSSYKFCFVRNP
jgi:hypothetical protein